MHHLHRIKRVPYVLWYGKHELTHVLIGLLFAWFLRELWNEFSLKYGLFTIIGSLIIDLDHGFYLFFYGKHDQYALEAKKFLRQGQIGTLFKYFQDNHKNNTSLATHNIYFIGFFALISIGAFWLDMRSSLAFFGAVVLHLLYDVLDDLWVKGYINENWKHLRRRKRPMV